MIHGISFGGDGDSGLKWKEIINDISTTDVNLPGEQDQLQERD